MFLDDLYVKNILKNNRYRTTKHSYMYSLGDTIIVFSDYKNFFLNFLLIFFISFEYFF